MKVSLPGTTAGKVKTKLTEKRMKRNPPPSISTHKVDSTNQFDACWATNHQIHKPARTNPPDANPDLSLARPPST